MNENKAKIIDDLLDAGNQCLIRFGDRNELASEHDKRISLLLQCLENFFLHGFKENQNLFNLTRKMISNSLSNSPKNFNHFVSSSKDADEGFWRFITYFLNKHEIERFSHLKHIKTSLGRSRAFLRSSLNEHKLERYLKSMLENGSTIVKQFYEEDAAIRDLKKQNEILELVSKLNSVLFASTIDNPNLNNLTGYSKPDFKNRTTTDNQTDLSDQKLKEEQNSQQQDNQMASSKTDIEAGKIGSKSSLILGLMNSPNSLSRTNSSKLDLNLPLSRNSSYSSNYQQDDANLLEDKSDDEANEVPIFSNVLLTPIVSGNYSITDQFIAPTYNDDDEKVSDFSTNTSCSSTPAFHSKELANFERTKRLFDKEFESINNKQKNTRLKESKQFEEKLNSKETNEEKELANESRKLFTTSPDQLGQFEEKISKLESHNDQLKNENKLLKVQLVKYIDAISLLQSSDRNAIFKCVNNSNSNLINDDNDLSKKITGQTTASLNENTNKCDKKNFNQFQNSNLTTIKVDYQQQLKAELNANAYFNYRELNEYETKLVQVAEMHGEIVEYNDRLHRMLMQKDATIKRLKDQLIELRGPLPDNIQSDEDEIVSIASDSESQSLQFNSVLIQNTRPLISIWIPSAFLADQKQTYQNSYLSADQQRSTKKVSQHHVYQIYVRIKDDEWNVYRRYSQFYAIHQILKKKYQQIAELEFPPKKTIGNRSAKVVQERRKKLEAYLRNALNILQNNNNIFDRSTLTEVLPFLSEKYILHNKNETNVKNFNNDTNTDEPGIVQQQDYIGL